MVNFAERMNDIKASDIRELLALVNKPEIISFAGGLPAPELFPVDKIKAATDAVMDENGRAALQYGPTDGLLRLREQIADRLLAKNGIHTDPEHIIMTAGSQQGLDFAARLFVNPGDVVLMESPSYLGAINAFKLSEPTFKEVPTDNGGMVMEELDKVPEPGEQFRDGPLEVTVRKVEDQRVIEVQAVILPEELPQEDEDE